MSVLHPLSLISKIEGVVFLYKENHLLSEWFKKAGRLCIDKKISFDIIKLGLPTN